MDPLVHTWMLACGLRQNIIEGGFHNCMPVQYWKCIGCTIILLAKTTIVNWVMHPHLGIFNQLFVDDPLWDAQGCSTLEQVAAQLQTCHISIGTLGMCSLLMALSLESVEISVILRTHLLEAQLS